MLAAESASAHIAGDVPYFEACLPLKNWRGAGAKRWLRPMKPWG